MNSIIDEDINNICLTDLSWEKLKGKTILITGARGYIATYLIYTFLRLNDIYKLNMQIIGLCRNERKSVRYFGNIINRNDFKLIIQDVCENIDDKYMSDIVIHAASPGNFFEHKKNPYEVIKANVFGLDNIMKKCELWNSEILLYFSSCMVYGNGSGYYSEESEELEYIDFTSSKNVYILSKRMGEMMIHSKKNSGFITKTMIARPLSIFGPLERYSEKKPFTDFLGSIVKDEDIRLKSSGLQQRSYLYISDAIKGIMYILLYGKDCNTYNISSEKNKSTILGLAELFVNINPQIKIIRECNSNIEDENAKSIRFAQNEKLRLLGWNEEVDLIDGIKRTVDWVQDSDFLYN